MTIVCGTDFSSSSVEAVRIAATIAAKRSESLLLTHVVQPAVSPPEARYSGMLLEVSQNELCKVRNEIAGEEVRVETATVIGSPAEAILEHAPADTSMIVVAARGHTHGLHLAVGSVTERLARLTRYPLFVVRHPAAINEWLRGEKILPVLVAGSVMTTAPSAAMLEELGPCEARDDAGESGLVVVGIDHADMTPRSWHASLAHLLLHDTAANVLCIPATWMSRRCVSGKHNCMNDSPLHLMRTL